MYVRECHGAGVPATYRHHPVRSDTQRVVAQVQHPIIREKRWWPRSYIPATSTAAAVLLLLLYYVPGST